MKGNKNTILAIAAGAAVVGLLGFLLGTEKGGKTTKKWTRKGGRLYGDVEGLIGEAKSKLTELQRSTFSGCEKAEKTTANREKADV